MIDADIDHRCAKIAREIVVFLKLTVSSLQLRNKSKFHTISLFIYGLFS